MILLRKTFAEYQKGVTRYDRTDNIKAEKDSDILAEKKRSNARSYVNSAKTGVAGGIVGSAIGAAVGGYKKKSLKGVKEGAKIGAGAGAALGTAGKLAATHKEREENRWVNRRLSEAKRQATRREAKDWKNNTVGRESYSSFSNGQETGERMYADTGKKVAKGAALGTAGVAGAAGLAYGGEKLANKAGEKIVTKLAGKRGENGKFVKLSPTEKKIKDLAIKARDNKTVQNAAKKLVHVIKR